MVEHPTADRIVPDSNPGAPCTELMELINVVSSSNQNCHALTSMLHVDNIFYMIKGRKVKPNFNRNAQAAEVFIPRLMFDGENLLLLSDLILRLRPARYTNNFTHRHKPTFVFSLHFGHLSSTYPLLDTNGRTERTDCSSMFA